VLAPGKRARLHRLLYELGPGNGTLMFLPIDQGIEHGPRDFFPNPDSKDPEYQFRLAVEGGYSAIACQIGFATKYWPDYAGHTGLILKINGKTDVGSSARSFSALNASVEDAVRLGADAVGYTLYVGSPRQDDDLLQLKAVREDCDRYGMRWSSGPTRAARTSTRLAPAPYDELEVTQEEAIRQCVESAGRALVVLSGGSRVDDHELLAQARTIMEAGGSGVIYGRNVWQRELEAAKSIVEEIKQVLSSSVRRTP
jgi:class I fructose-bisphosphate aldolase